MTLAGSANEWTITDGMRLRTEDKSALTDAVDQFFYQKQSLDYLLAERAIEEAVSLARAFEEPAWEIYARHWRLQLWIHFLGRISRGLDEALDLVSFASDPKFQHLPQRICAYDDLICCYIFKDWKGYRALVMDTIHKLLGEVNDGLECRGCMNHYLGLIFALEGDLEGVRRIAAQYLEIAGHFAESKADMAALLGDCHLVRGEAREALEQFQREQHHRTGTFIEKPINGMAESRLLLGHLHRARKTAEKALRIARSASNAADQFRAYRTLARVQQAGRRRRLPEALEFFQLAHQSIAAAGFNRGEIETLIEIVRIKHELGQDPSRELRQAAELEAEIPSDDLGESLRSLRKCPPD